MSRSIKKPIVKDAPRNVKKSTQYWRHVRKSINQAVRKLFYNDEVEIPNPKTIVNDYDYSDFTILPYDEETKKKFKRK